jgi:hypothetical protein
MFDAISVLGEEVCAELGLMGGPISTASVIEAIERSKPRATRLERNLRSENLPPVQRRNFEARLQRLEAAIAEAESIIPGGGSYVGGTHADDGYAGSAEEIVNRGLVKCRAEGCAELIARQAAFFSSGWCERHVAIARGLPDPDAWRHRPPITNYTSTRDVRPEETTTERIDQ